MVFNSLRFLYFFLPITYFVFWQLRTKSQRYVWMTLTGYIFYSFWNYKFCLLMALSTAVSYGAGLGFLKWGDNAKRRRLLLITPIVFDLSLLGFFKYWNFGASAFNAVLEPLFGIRPITGLNIVLPVGISFYTFHTITYIVDGYRGVIRPTRNFFEFSCYVSLFAQLVAGPIVRFREIEQDLEHLDQPNHGELLEEGWSFFAIGMIKKILIADSIAAIINPAFARHETLSTTGVWLCVLGYSYQLYFDFSGYSDMAVGLGRMFGLRLPQNFNSPYKAVDMADFWRRWHISLSSVLRDYLFIPLGGSRGSTVKTYRNLMLTMLLGGLWHGASWTFVAWGGYHGALLCLNRALRDKIAAAPKPACKALTFLAVIVGWVFFRADSFSMAADLLKRMFIPHAGDLPTGAITLAVGILVAGVVAHATRNTWEMEHTRQAALNGAVGVLFVLCLVVIYGGNQSPFLYFQF